MPLCAIVAPMLWRYPCLFWMDLSSTPLKKMQDWYWNLARNQWLGSLSFPKVKSTIILPKEHSIKLFSKTHRLMPLLDVPHQRSFLCSRHQLVQKFKIGPSTDTKWMFGHKWYICIIPAPLKAQGPPWKIVWKAVRTRGQRRLRNSHLSTGAACSDQTSQHWSVDVGRATLLAELLLINDGFWVRDSQVCLLVGQLWPSDYPPKHI